MCDPFNMPDCQLWSDRRSKVSLEERKGRKYIGENKDKKLISNFNLDGCIIESSELKKADFIFLICDEYKAYIVELKGADLVQAQMNSSLDSLLDYLVDYRPIYGRIVLSKVRGNDTRSTELSRLMKRFKTLGGNLKYQSRELKENL